MERLTCFEDGKWVIKKGSMTVRSHDVEDLAQMAIDRLAHYEDLEEHGRLVVPPVPVGDKVWSTLDDLGRLHECEVVSIHFGRKPHEKYIELEPVSYRGRRYVVSFHTLGKTVFFTREEAEATLKKWNGQN